MQSVLPRSNAHKSSTIGSNQKFLVMILQMMRLLISGMMLTTATTRCLMLSTMGHPPLRPTAQLSQLPVFELRGRLLSQPQLVSHLQEDPTSWIGLLVHLTPNSRLNMTPNEPQLCSSPNNSSYSKLRSETSIRPSKPFKISWTTLNDTVSVLIVVWIDFETRSTSHLSSTKRGCHSLLPVHRITSQQLLRH